MTKIYATQDNDGHRIWGGANIKVFDTPEDAVDFAASAWGLDEGETLTVEAGEFSDCWIKMRRKPVVGDHMLAPFTYNDVIIQPPGTHPGGREYWLTPRRDVLVAVVEAEA